VQHFVPDFNRRFTVTPAQAGSAFVSLGGVDLELLLSAQHERVVRNDSTVPFEARTLQLPQRPERPHYVRCPVLVHEFPQGTLGISYQGRLLARYDATGALVTSPPSSRDAAGTLRRRARVEGPQPAGRPPGSRRPAAPPRVSPDQPAAAAKRKR